MSGRLPIWLAEWLGVELPTEGDAATWQLHSGWSWAPWLTLLIILAAVAGTVWLYSRESSSAGRGYRALLVALRLAAIGLLLIMLAEWALALRLSGAPTLALLIDRSASMAIADRYNEPELMSQLEQRLTEAGLPDATRLNLAKLLVAEQEGRRLTELAERYRLEVYLVADGVERLPRASGVMGAASEATETAAALRRAVVDLTADGPDSKATRLGDAVRHVLDDLRGAPPAALVLLSDGVTTAGAPLAEAAEDARRRGVPLVAIGIGSDQPPRDIELADVLVDDVIFADDLVSFQIQIRSTGLEGQPARVELRRGDQSQPVAEQGIVLGPPGQMQTVHLTDRPVEPGEVAYSIEVLPHADETDPENNRQRRVVAVRDEPIRVLLAYAYPSYEFRFLKTLLERDRTIRLSTYLQDADPDYAEQDMSALRSFPAGREELLEYDVLVIGDINPRLLPRSVWPSVRALVAEKGGGVAMLAGLRYLPWLYRDNLDVAALLPIEVDSLPAAAGDRLSADISGGFVARPTPLGLRAAALQLGDDPAQTEQIWRGLAPHYWLAEVGRLKPGAQVLAEHPTHTLSDGRNLPVICFQYFGAGRVLFHAVDSTWRWRSGAGEVYFSRYWIQTIRQLARGTLSRGRGAELISDRREYRRGEPVELRARFLDVRLAPAGETGVTVLIESDGQPSRRAALRRNPAAAGLFEATISDLPPAAYQVLMTEPQLPGEPPAAQFSVVLPPGEMARTEMDRAALTAAAQVSRGTFYTIDEVDQMLAKLPPGRRVPIENLPPLAIWNQWWLLAALLTCLTTEWILRKQKGML